MKTLGMIGGLGPESSIDYYRSILAGYAPAQTIGDTRKSLSIASTSIKASRCSTRTVLTTWQTILPLEWKPWYVRVLILDSSQPTLRTWSSTKCSGGRRYHYSALSGLRPTAPRRWGLGRSGCLELDSPCGLRSIR